MVITSTWEAEGTWVSGSTITSMVRAVRSGQMDHGMRGSTKTGKSKPRGHCSSGIAANMSESLLTMRSVAMESTTGWI